jgi:NADPH:quinone reductase-like Zn-dependent oxidoreductase
MAQQWQAARFGGPEALELVRTDIAPPAAGFVVVDVRAASMNPADYKHIAPGQDPALLPLTLGFEVAGVIRAAGPGTEIASGGGVPGDEVIAAQITGGYATQVSVRADDVFAKPPALSFAAASGLILAGSTAAELLHTVGVTAADTVLLHGAAGAVGTSVLQQARLAGARVIGTSSPDSFDMVRRYGGEPVRYGPGLEQRVRALAPGGITAALDTVGTDEAADVSLTLVPDRARIVTTAAFSRAAAAGFDFVGARNPRSGPYRAQIRSRLIELAAAGRLVVPVGATFPFAQAPAALAALMGRHPAGKLVLTVGS